MGLLGTVFLGPVKLVTWTAERILEAAEAQYHDPAAIRNELARLNDEYEQGRIDDATFLAVEDELMERLDAARDHQREP